MAKAIDTFLKNLKTNGNVKEDLKNMQTREELYNTIHYKPGKEWYYPTKANTFKKWFHILFTFLYHIIINIRFLLFKPGLSMKHNFCT